jgi:hypothetical protein
MARGRWSGPLSKFRMKACALWFASLFFSFIAYGQGTVYFQNVPYLGTGFAPNAPVYLSDGVTLVSGPQFDAELLAGPNASSLVSIATTEFLDGAESGYFFGGRTIINGIAPQATAWVEVRVWNTASGPSFVQAQSSGLPNSWWQSPIFSVVTGGGADPSPGILAGLGNSPVALNASVPEPSAAALFGLCGGLMIFRRMLNNLPEPNRRPIPPLLAGQQLGRAFHDRGFALVAGRSAKCYATRLFYAHTNT